ncbi:hypothetical protein GGX14DRAFT_572198 [Mycena pura]|uniref:Uncharacterized protein n=1 Tax=Mycena pura TaxID=153505 RepID=A0AAD6V2H2_9AGAR|nr:hypothetical protein GGX14DRAFT_572198 [Mycena pura]
MIPDQRKHVRTLRLRASPQLLPTPGRALHLKKHGATISNTSATLRHRAPCLAWSRPRRLKRHSLRAAPRIHFPCYHPKEEKTSLKTTLDIDPQPPTAPPDTPPHKSAKRSHLDSQTRDVPHSERESPSHRYAGKGPRAYAHPLANPFQRARHRNASPTPTRLQTTSLTDDEYLANDPEYSPLDENHPFFLPNPADPAPSPPTFARAADLAPSPSASPSPSPAPLPSQPTFAPVPPPDPPSSASAPSPSPSSADSAPSPSPSASTNTPSPPPSPTDTAMPGADDMDDVVVVVFKAPTREAILAATPVGADKNPHRPSPAHDPNDPQAFAQYSSVQSNDPLWTAPVMPDHVVLENMSDETVAAVTAAPGEYLGITAFCYGSVLANQYKNIHTDILSCLEEVAGKGKITLILPMAKNSALTMRRGLGGTKANKFVPPIALIARCTDKGARDRCTDQATFGATRTLAFHVTTFDAARLSHAVGFFRTDITDLPTVTARRQGGQSRTLVSLWTVSDWVASSFGTSVTVDGFGLGG